MSIAEDERRKDEEMDRQALLAEQRREEERLLQEEQQREKMVKIKAVEGKMNDLLRVLNTNMIIFLLRWDSGCDEHAMHRFSHVSFGPQRLSD